MKKCLIVTKLIIAFSFNCSAQNYQWGFGIGGSFFDSKSNCLTVNPYGQVYIIGSFGDTLDFDPGTGITNLAPGGSFIAKYDTIGNFIWAKKVGAVIKKIVSDSTGVYLTGEYGGTVDFDPDTSVSLLYSNLTGNSLFIAKYDTAGNYLWAQGLTGPSVFNYSNDLQVDNLGNTYITGSFADSIDFDPTSGTIYLKSLGNADIFLAKYDLNGTYNWAYNFGTVNTEGGTCLSLNDTFLVFSGTIHYDTIDFNPGIGVFNLYPSTGSIFIAKYSLGGNFINAISLNGNLYQNLSTSISISNSGNIVIAGNFVDTLDFDPGPLIMNLVSPLGSNTRSIFFARYDSNLNYIFAKNIANTSGGVNAAIDIAIDGNDYLYLTGLFSGTADFDPGPNTYFLSEQVGGSTYDIFFAKYDNLANFLWAKSMGSTYPDAGNSIALSPIGSGIYLTGYFTNSIDLDPGPGNATYTLQTGNESIFLAKYSNTVTNIFNEQANENITLSAYPNPSKETITIKTGQGTFIATSNLKIVNTLGETVYQKQIVNTQTPIQLDVSFLKAGLYVVSLSSQKGNGYARFMKLE